MSQDVILPALGESVTEGTITEWYVAVGDTVEADQPLFELSSDKIDTEVPAPVAGTVLEILAHEDDTVEVGAVVARIGAAGAAPAASAPATPAPAATAPASTTAPATAAPVVPAGDVYASPLVRQLAAEKGVDLKTLTGTGEGGRITREDVEHASASAPSAPAPAATSTPAPAPKAASAAPAPKAATSTPAPAATGRVRIEKLNRVRGKIAEKMLESQEKAAQLTTFQEVDVTNLMAARAKVKNAFKAREGISLSPFAMVARAAVIATKNHPVINAYADWDTMELHIREYVNMGIAVDTEKGLLVPNIKNAQNLTVAGLAQGIADLAAKARGENGAKIDFADIQNGTMTLTNTGSRGVLFDTPILNYPEVAILGVGAIVKRPSIVKGPNGEELIGIRDMMYLSLSYDHRLIDGADAARYVTEVKQVIESLDWDRELA
ncbi:2-oxoglutarate dehydrogenase, E2 component, dihydrolipoamide succinyltransferase [Stomatohabitans albus]|uniref:2-oxoglutarate dehydrogenase, E2 component, dihydrolipoamide succinyltransferase n=1 Tax=Stomatohabitans albus TaxID=3110766 RepID=UPI00300D813A